MDAAEQPVHCGDRNAGIAMRDGTESRTENGRKRGMNLQILRM